MVQGCLIVADNFGPFFINAFGKELNNQEAERTPNPVTVAYAIPFA